MSGSFVTRLFCIALASTVISAVDIDVAEAKRKTLLEQWFPKAAQRMKRQRGLAQPPVITERRQAVPVKKVSGPAYYTYKTEQLHSMALAGLLPVIAPEVIVTKTLPQKPVTKIMGSELLGEDDWRSAKQQEIDLASTGSTKTIEVVGSLKTKIIPAHALTNEMVENISLKLEEGIASAIKDHYTKDPSFLWVDRDWKITENAKAVLSVLKNADEVGLSDNEYVVDTVSMSVGAGAKASKRAVKFELEMTAALLRYGADAKSGRIDPNGISGYHDFPTYKRNYSAVLAEVISSENPAGALSGLNPDNSRFAMLMAELAELRSNMDEDALEPIAAGTFFKPGQEHAELPKIVALIEKKASADLKETHSALFASYSGSIRFENELVTLVKDFQKETGLGADGIVGKNTIAKLQTASPQAKIDKIELAMERLRWLPETLGDRYVFINQPAYNASYMVNDKAQLSMRTIIGKPTNQTYFFHDKIKIVEVNPYWNVPRSILINQKLGKIRANPGYLSANGFEVITARGVTDPYSVDWYSGSLNGVQIRQKPGGGNALGELKILFPNKHAIYMHDTPSRNLFSRADRAYSSGCVRLHKPREMAAAVMGTSVDYISGQIASGENRAMKVKNQIPVYVSYFTAWPKDDGVIGYYSDVYGRDAALKKAIKRNSEMRLETSLASS
ncbi:MAG: L,D-transpeptidase family protein [Salaquimonas sp.]